MDYRSNVSERFFPACGASLAFCCTGGREQPVLALRSHAATRTHRSDYPAYLETFPFRRNVSELSSRQRFDLAWKNFTQTIFQNFRKVDEFFFDRLTKAQFFSPIWLTILSELPEKQGDQNA
jgi:hypothetical protein